MASSVLAVSSSCAASAFVGQRLSSAQPAVNSRAPALPCRRQVSRRAGAARAKYGDESVYFDLKDLPNTTGSWDLYGVDQKDRYNKMQSKVFEIVVTPFTKRGLLAKFLLLGGAAQLIGASINSPNNLLPIKTGPLQPSTPGPRGRL
ncbi:photosystem I subunit VI [Klebsormidium nitens]|uniref:Photosystem I subunit VI n=1 Tax=Klebsormidium nitens TaxID=105231 RepID=A0A1Y1IBH7_KLENI|nr:photosystem I subunit VI [Klebsormidium nitens]|eukprot:GAQ86077.1 photosystem I subunit VI [Klebsormidium nitens]